LFSNAGVTWSRLLYFPRLIRGELANSAMQDATATRLRSIYQRDSPDLVLLIVDPDTKNWVVETVFVDVPWMYIQVLFGI